MPAHEKTRHTEYSLIFPIAALIILWFSAMKRRYPG